MNDLLLYARALVWLAALGEIVLVVLPVALAVSLLFLLARRARRREVAGG
ncbi:hypothetical protein GCM10027160_29380 [Streptomyces calidiresistens]|uniref:Uncharacterized protein n=1 Tax=Streptomyces calidiresistens TaxID=1485586 RepID=A0A7W3T1H6_9ACTN|nr:hypothetical protein [Streptomyces calidiresistens]MBB0229141.1 hypothetical protein [Streptomyces calidiresistens]